jgi:hypothetical protein
MVEAKHNAAPGALSALMEGCDLRVFLEPDDSVKNRFGTERYTESLDLPHIIGRGTSFWASQRNLVVSSNGRNLVRGAYAYFSGADIFARSAYESDDQARARAPLYTQIMSTGRYRRLEWRIKPGPTLVYDSDRPDDRSAYVEAIEAGARFKALIDFEDGTFQIHPVIYPFHYPDRDAIELQTELQFFPDYMRLNPTDLAQTIFAPTGNPIPDAFETEQRERVVALKSAFFSSYFKLFDRAKVQRVYDLESGATITARRVRVFAAD